MSHSDNLDEPEDTDNRGTPDNSNDSASPEDVLAIRAKVLAATDQWWTTLDMKLEDINRVVEGTITASDGPLVRLCLILVRAELYRRRGDAHAIASGALDPDA